MYVHVVAAVTESAIVQNYRRKEADAVRLGVEVVERTKELTMDNLGLAVQRGWNPYNPQIKMEIPEWMTS